MLSKLTAPVKMKKPKSLKHPEEKDPQPKEIRLGLLSKIQGWLISNLHTARSNKDLIAI